MAKILILGLILARFWAKFGPYKVCSWNLPLQDVGNCFKLSCMQFQGKLMNQTWENGNKPSFGSDFGTLGPNSGGQIFFSKNLAFSRTRYHGQIPSCTISEKTNDPVLRKPSDGRTNGWTDGRTNGQTDGSDFIGPCRLTSSVQQNKN